MIEGIKLLFLALSISITQYVYPVIPRLYDIFMYFADFEFFNENFIHDVWNNIYVLVGVVVMFAIAIKLISAMVNPDTLTDNKKGVKGAYLRAVIAVILIFVFPILFEIVVDVQKDLLKDQGNSLLTRIYGYKVKGDVGQSMAWETFSAFCTLVDDSTGVAVDMSNSKNSYYTDYYRTEKDIDNIRNLDTELWMGGIIEEIPLAEEIFRATNMANDGVAHIRYEYHPILCPLAGCLVAYEMLLLCMDTIFRAAKLAILELMLPIVLGAFVFNADILKKWAKEFISTYLIVFLKILAIGFMVIAIQALKAKGVI